MQLTLLGTGTPIPELRRRGPASLLVAGNARILVDAGSGVVHRLLETGQPGRGIPGAPPALTHIYLTHLHSDHIMGLPDLLWTGWIMGWWATPPVVFGPPGTVQMLTRLEHTFDYDIAGGGGGGGSSIGIFADAASTVQRSANTFTLGQAGPGGPGGFIRPGSGLPAGAPGHRLEYFHGPN